MSNCSCITPDGYRFHLDQTCEYVLYTDFSTWVEGEDYVKPIYYTIAINSEDAGKVAEVNVYTEKPTEIKIKDGVYDICFEACGIKYKRTAAIIPTLKCCADVYKTQENYDETTAEILEMYIDFIEVNGRLNQTRVARDYFIKARTLIERLNCNCNL